MGCSGRGTGRHRGARQGGGGTQWQRAGLPLTPPRRPPTAHPRAQAAKEGQRLDGRALGDLRAASFDFSLDDTSCTVVVGGTRVLAVVSASLEAPYPDRAREGSLRFNIEYSPMASAAFEPGGCAGDARCRALSLPAPYPPPTVPPPTRNNHRAHTLQATPPTRPSRPHA